MEIRRTETTEKIKDSRGKVVKETTTIIIEIVHTEPVYVPNYIPVPYTPVPYTPTYPGTYTITCNTTTTPISERR